MKRYLDTVVRRPWLYLPPVLLVLGVSSLLALKAVHDAPSYSAGATVAVNLDPWLSRQVGEQPPADEHAALLGELMQSDSFILTALARTSLAGKVNDPSLAGTVRTHWKTVSAGPNTIHVTYACPGPDACAEVVSAVLSAFQDEVAAARVAKAKATADFYTKQLQQVDQQLQGIPATDPSRLTVRQTYESIAAKLSDAQLQLTVEQQTGQTQFKTISAPRVAHLSTAKLKAGMMPLLFGAAVAAALAFVPVALMTWTDNSARTPDDVFEQLGLRTVAVVPHGWETDTTAGEQPDSAPRRMPFRRAT
jgi:hypothetical protein